MITGVIFCIYFSKISFATSLRPFAPLANNRFSSTMDENGPLARTHFIDADGNHCVSGIGIEINYGPPAAARATAPPSVVPPTPDDQSLASTLPLGSSSFGGGGSLPRPELPAHPLTPGHKPEHNLTEGDLAYVGRAPDDATGYQFECPPIRIKNADGLPDIDVLDAYRYLTFTDRTFSNKTYKETGVVQGLALPASLYPPSWDSLEDVRKPIRQAAKASGIELFCKTTISPDKKKTKTEGEGAHFILGCNFNGISQDKKKKEEEFANAAPRLSEWGVSMPHYNYEDRQDPIIGQARGIRPGDGSKGAGLKEGRRTGTEKRSGETTDNGGKRCPFQLRVNLIEGVCWYVPWKNSSNLCHCGHIELGRGELNAKKNTVSDKAKKAIKAAAKQFSLGGGMQNFAKELTGMWFRMPMFLFCILTCAFSHALILHCQLTHFLVCILM